MKIKKIEETPGILASVIDNLESISSIDALSANMGKELNSNKLDKCIQITEPNTDLNDYLENGIYYFSGNAVKPLNVPAGSAGFLRVMKGVHITSGYIRAKQIWYRVGTQNGNDYETYVRTYLSDNETQWSDWRMLDIVDKYSTDEYKTNKIWVDNKPIYRKVLTGNFGSTTGAWTNLVKANITDCDTMVSISGNIKNPSNGDNLPIPSYESTSYYANIMYNQKDDYVKYYVKGWTYSAFKMVYRIIIEYTKTTD